MELIRKQETALSSTHSNSPIQQAVRANGFKKLQDCNTGEITTVLRYAMVLIGMTEKDALSELEETVLLDFIRDEYGNRFTSEDLRLAFRWAMSGKTDVDKSFYGKRFSVAYLSNFMEAYEVKKKEMLELSKRNTPVMQLVEDTRTKEEINRDTFNVFEKYVLENKKMPPAFDVVRCFSHLKVLGKLDFSKEKIAEMQYLAKVDMFNEYERLKLHDMFQAQSQFKKLNDEQELRFYTKRKYVECYLKSLIA